MRPIEQIQADIEAVASARLGPVRGKQAARRVDANVSRADALRQELLAAQAAERPVPERPAKGVTVERARAATHVNVGGVWKPIIAWNPKSVVVLWGGTDRERIPLARLTAGDLQTRKGNP